MQCALIRPGDEPQLDWSRLAAQDQAEDVELVGKRRWSCLAFVSRKVRLTVSLGCYFTHYSWQDLLHGRSCTGCSHSRGKPIF